MQRAGFWGGGVSRVGCSEARALWPCRGATEQAEELIDVGQEESRDQRERDQQHRHHDLVRARGRRRGRATSEGDTRRSGRT